MKRLESLFQRVFPNARVEMFGDECYSGFHDGAKGVQWHIAHKKATETYILAVNLEGIKYQRKRPIRALMDAELRSPAVPGVIRGLPRRNQVRVRVVREGWPSLRRRVYLARDYRCICCRSGARLNEQVWAKAMSEARRCIAESDERARQRVLRKRSTTLEWMEVLPHLTVGLPLWTGAIPSDAQGRLVAARDELQPSTRLRNFP
jgi:hypothetical protein